MCDVEFSREGSIVLLRPISRAAVFWVEENIGDDALWFGDALALDRRYAADIVGGMAGDGLSVEG